MIYQKIPLSAEDNEIFLEVYAPEKVWEHHRKAILVIPGGGYSRVCVEREGEPVALAFVAEGYAAFVLRYSVGRKKPFPAQLLEASKAMAYIKDHAEEYNIDPNEVFAVGFSAGGHLTATLGTMWKHPAVTETLGIPYGYNKPRGTMLIYPVICGSMMTLCNLLCKDDPSPEELEMVMLDRHVDEDTVPAFIMHTVTDEIVPVMDSLVMAQAMNKAGRSFEMHVYPKAPHGIALGTEITSMGNPGYENAEIAKWVKQAVAWADSLAE